MAIETSVAWASVVAVTNTASATSSADSTLEATRHPMAVCHLAGAGAVDIRDDDLADVALGRQESAVKLPDPAGAEDVRSSCLSPFWDVAGDPGSTSSPTSCRPSVAICIGSSDQYPGLNVSRLHGPR